MKKFAVAGLLSAAFTGTVMAAAPFTDLAPNHWAYKQIAALKDAGIIKGYPNGTLKGNENISRYEAAQMVYNALQYVNRMKSGGASVDPQLMDTINALIMELTDEMQIAEVRIEENSNAINALRKHVESHHGRGVDVPMGNGRIKLMGQAMFSLVSGGDDSSYRALNTGTVAGAEGATEFIADYFDIAMAADIDSKTSFHTRASIYTGGNANGAVPGGNSIAFDDYLYFHVNDLWSGWGMTFGRQYLPIGHEVGGAFRTNPYFVSNSLVEQMYGYMTDGAFFTNSSDNSNWHWGAGINNGEFLTAGNRVRNHANHANVLGRAFAPVAPVAPAALPAGVAAANSVVGLNTTNAGVNTGTVNNNQDDELGYVLQIGNSHHDGDFKWDLTWVTNSADMGVTGANTFTGVGEQEFLNFGMTYRMNEDWQFSGEYVDGSIQNFVGNGAAADRIGRNAGANFGAAAGANGVVAEDDFTTWYLQAVYNLNSNQTVGVRYSTHELDRAGAYAVTAAGAAAGYDGSFDDELSEWALAWTRKVSNNGTLIIEYSAVDVDRINGRDVNHALNAGVAGGGVRDDFDVIRASYRIDF